jgi:putative Mg2+ transporter-C (MgtC) family protein
MLMIAADAGSPPDRDINRLIEPLGYHAQFRRQSQSSDRQHTMLSFEIRWTRPQSAGPPLDLLRAVEQDYVLASFELTSEARH